MASNRIGGVLTFSVDGTVKQVRGNWTVSPNMVKREGVAGQDGVHGYIELPVVPGAKGDFTTTPGVSVSDLQNITDSTVTIKMANGTTYTLTDAWANPAVEISTSEGRYPIDFGCKTCTEVVSTST